jgi:chromosome segregation ATPase
MDSNTGTKHVDVFSSPDDTSSPDASPKTPHEVYVEELERELKELKDQHERLQRDLVDSVRDEIHIRDVIMKISRENEELKARLKQLEGDE